MKGPRFSIMIPTRERARTLGPCIETCLAQKYENLEVLVSDNASSPETREVVAGFQDPRLKYFRQESRVSMRQNFEFLANQATGDYLIFIGDDDGMMPNAIANMAEYLSQNPVDVLNWTGVVYYWPDRMVKGAGVINFKYQKIFGMLSRVDPQQRLAGFVSGQIQSYIYGCNIYHGCVSRRVIDEVRQKTGRVFSDHMPDVYACVAFLFSAKTMVYLDHPLTICGVSLASNGFSFFADRGEGMSAAAKTPHQKFADEANADPDIPRKYNPHLRASQYHAASALLIANDYFGRKQNINLEAWAQTAVREASQYCDLASVIDTLDKNFELDRKIVEIVSRSQAAVAATPPAPDPQSKLKEKFNRMWVRARIGERDDVMTAFRTLEKLLPPRKIGNSNIAARLLNWLTLRRNRKLVEDVREAA